MTGDGVKGAIDAAQEVTESANAAALRAAIDHVNQRHAVVVVGGRTGVLREKLDLGGKISIELMGPGDLRVWFARQKFRNDGRTRGLGDIWLGHELRRQYESIVFAPEGAPADHYNLWRG